MNRGIVNYILFGVPNEAALVRFNSICSISSGSPLNIAAHPGPRSVIIRVLI